MTKLSVNINKVATLRNARGGNLPDVLRFALDCEAFGAQGITVHPRPDGRHIRYADVRDLTPILKTEFNIEGNPTTDFMELVCEQIPAQVTLVPDKEDALTSNAGWNTVEQFDFLKSIVTVLREKGIRSSIFVDPTLEMIQKAKELGADRVELYTEAYASEFAADKVAAIRPYKEAALFAKEIGLELNAGHDLNLDNLRYFVENIPYIAEVSIGHALISDALYYGIENTIQMYLNQLKF